MKTFLYFQSKTPFGRQRRPQTGEAPTPRRPRSGNHSANSEAEGATLQLGKKKPSPRRSDSKTFAAVATRAALQAQPNVTVRGKVYNITVVLYYCSKIQLYLNVFNNLLLTTITI